MPWDTGMARRNDMAVAPPRGTTVSAQRDRVFVGREREMGALLAALEDACATCGRLFLLVGEPGIGKTRTAEELAGQARRRGALVLSGRCHDGEGAPPYWPWIQILRAYARAAGPESAASMPSADIAQLFDALRPGAPSIVQSGEPDAEAARFRLFDGVTTFLKNAACGQPMVLILDDLHAADDASLLLLQFLAREIGDAALLIVGAYRDSGGGRRRRLLDAVVELVREPIGRLLTLEGFAEAEVARFMAAAGEPAPEASLVAAVHQRTAGNPFFLSQLLPLLAPGTQPVENRADELPIPRGVQEVIAARLGRLSPPCRRVLEIAAVAGLEVESPVIAAVAASASQPGDDTAQRGPESVLEPLEEALEQRILSEVPGAGGTVAFSHALIRDALYVGLSDGRRAQLHRLVGEVLENLSPAPNARRVAEIAHHFGAAVAGGGDVGKAISYARRAAAHARASLAYEEAARHYEAALGALAHGGADHRQECELLLGLGEAHRQASRGRAAREAYRRAGALARRLGEAELFARAALGFAGIVIGVEVDDEVIAVLEEALAIAAPLPRALHAMLLSRLALELYFSPDTTGRAWISAEAVAVARESGDRRALAHALEARHFAMWGVFDPRQRLALADEMIRLAARINSSEVLMRGYSLRIGALLELGRIEDVDATIAGHARLAEELRQPSHRWGAEMFAALRAMIDGRFAEAEERAAAAFALGRTVQGQTAASFFAAQMFFLRREQGRLAELEDGLRALADAQPKVPAWRCGLANLYAEDGRPADAAREIAAATASELRDFPRDNSWLPAVTLLADACTVVGDARRAALLYDLVLPYAGQVVVAGVASACTGAVDRSLGRLAVTLGRWAEAEQHFERALAMNRRLGGRPFVARTQYDLAAMWLSAHDTGEGTDASIVRARELLDAAQVTAHGLGMAALEARIDALRPRLGPAARASGKLPRPPREEVGGARRESVVDPSVNLFRDQGGYWTLAFEGQVCRLRDSKGLRYLAVLLRQPHHPVHVGELLRVTSPDAAGAFAARHPDDAGPIDACRERLRGCYEELEEAERFNDVGRAGAARAEIELVTDELTRRLGLESRADRRQELLRLRITKAIRAAIERIKAEHPALGHHVQTSIHTGSFCSYRPDPTKPIRWN
jgi:tetratricopeptide (TPR) repeat protein